MNEKYEALHDQLRHERELYEKSTNLLKEQLKKEAQSVEAAKESMEEVFAIKPLRDLSSSQVQRNHWDVVERDRKIVEQDGFNHRLNRTSGK